MAENDQVQKQRMVTYCCAKYVQQSLQQCSPLLGRRRRPERLSSCSASSVASLTLLIEGSKQKFRVEQLLTNSWNAEKAYVNGTSLAACVSGQLLTSSALIVLCLLI